ncbi:MAG TPA: hypothetical protein VG759_01810 [Candidatus Angelobacter sp.]|jgi:hypothetical protein|nr:hypothetical protein [Candidatus Angelobacter sp.]
MSFLRSRNRSTAMKIAGGKTEDKINMSTRSSMDASPSAFEANQSTMTVQAAWDGNVHTPLNVASEVAQRPCHSEAVLWPKNPYPCHQLSVGIDRMARISESK